MSERDREKEARAWTLTGWWLFVILKAGDCAGFFIIASINARDPFALLGSLFFMAGNIAAFLFPYYQPVATFHSRG